MPHHIRAVFVPFEIGSDGRARKRDDLPRFVEQEEAVNYIQTHPELSKWKLEWRMHSDKDLIAEYVRGVGTLRVLL